MRLQSDANISGSCPSTSDDDAFGARADEEFSTAENSHYLEWRYQRNKKFIALSFQCGAIAFLLCAFSDFHCYPTWFAQVTASLQGLFLAPLLLYVSRRITKGSVKECSRLSLLSALAAMITVSGLIVLAQSNGIAMPYEALLVLVLCILLLSGTSPVVGVLCSIPVLVYYFLQMSLAGASGGMLATQGVFLSITFFVGYLGALNLEMSTRRIYQMSMALITESTTDELTGLSNRRGIDEIFDKAWNVAKRENHSVALLFVDIDYFKRVNDRLGHVAGDLALSKVARCLASCVNRPLDVVGRVGGEEFVVVAYGTDEAGVDVLAKNIHHVIEDAAIANPDSPFGGRITVSIGAVSVKPKESIKNAKDAARAMLEEADKALYQAKNSGRNRTCVYRASSAVGNVVDFMQGSPLLETAV